MFCTNCGHQNADNVGFCQNCGAQLTAQSNPQPTPQQTTYQQPTYQQPAYQQPTYQQPTYQQPVYQQPAYQQSAYQQPTYATYPQDTPVNPAAAQSVWDLMKRICSSPLALVAVIAFTAAALFSFISSLTFNGGNFADLYDIASEFGMEDMIGEMYSVLRSTTVVSAIFGMIPSVLIVVGLWLTFASAANKQTSGIKTAGFTIIKVLLTVELVFVCIGVALIVILLMIGTAVVAGNYDAAYAVGLLVGLMIGFAIAFALVIVYLVLAIKTVGTMRSTAISGIPSDKVSGFVAVFSFIQGGSTVLSLAGSANAFAVLSSLASATACIAFGIFLFSYRTKMRGMMFMPVGSYYAGSQSYGVPQQVSIPYSQPQSTGWDASAQANAAPYAQPQSTAWEQPAPTESVPQYVACPYCGTQYSAQESICPTCGQPKS